MQFSRFSRAELHFDAALVSNVIVHCNSLSCEFGEKFSANLILFIFFWSKPTKYTLFDKWCINFCCVLIDLLALVNFVICLMLNYGLSIFKKSNVVLMQHVSCFRCHAQWCSAKVWRSTQSIAFQYFEKGSNRKREKWKSSKIENRTRSIVEGKHFPSEHLTFLAKCGCSKQLSKHFYLLVK